MNEQRGIMQAYYGVALVTLSGNSIVGHANPSYGAISVPASGFSTVVTLQNNTIEANAATVTGGGSLLLSTGK